MRNCNDEQEARRIIAVKKALTKHGLSDSSLYSRWSGMLQRCNNLNNPRYKDYGGRGIKVCKRWYDFEHFYEDMSQGFSSKLSLDRIDCNANYCKSNCRWATPKEQQNNLRNNTLITFKGKTRTLHDWAEELNLHPGTIAVRIRRDKMSPQDALSTPIIPRIHSYTYKGETHTLRDWSKITGIKATTISMRIRRRNWTLERALTTPTKE